ncbi:MAG: D-alanyl-D-alanine carboxypeptidase [Rhodothermales bacterium]|jgi:D-alanyl-D-alanine carboxypeptidase
MRQTSTLNRTGSWISFLACLLVLSACAPPKPAPLEPGPEAELQALLDAGIEKGIPGLSAVVATSEGVVWSGVSGMANLQTGAPVRPDMLFGIGSITKTFVAVVVLQLVEEGLLDVSATSADVLGAAVDGIPNADQATIGELLNHTGGVPSWEDDPIWIREGRGADLKPDHIWGKAETLPYIHGHEPLAGHGEAYSYANTNYTLLGLIIEKVTGNEAVDEIHRRILDPLELTNIRLEGFEDVPSEQLPQRYHWATPDFAESAGVNAAFSEVRPGLVDASASNLSVEWTAGGMVASARDLALYAVALRDGRLLKPESMEFLTDWFPIDDRTKVGHNVFRNEYPDGLAVIGHSGAVLGFTGSLFWLEEGDVVVAVVSNVGTMHSGRNPGSAGSVARAREFIDAAIRLAAEQNLVAPESRP